MKILITGGAGSLGVNLVERFLTQGHDLFVIDNFATGHREALPDVALREGSIADATLVRDCFKQFRPDIVVHSAAAYKDPDDWREDCATNVTGTINVVEAAKDAGVARLINFQTALCYGRPTEVPIPVRHPTRPFTSYGISKTAGEAYLALSGLPCVSFRLANIVCPRLSIGPLPTFYKRLKEGKSCFCSDTVRDFLDIEDFFVLMDLAMAEGAPQGVFNVSTGEGHSIKDVFDLVVGHLGIELTEPVPILAPGDDDVPAVVLDPSVTEEAFGWQAKIGFKDSLERMLAWYDKFGVHQVYSHLAAPAS